MVLLPRYGLLILDKTIILSRFVGEARLGLGLQVFVPYGLLPVFQVTGVRTQGSISRLMHSLDKAPPQQIDVLTEVVHRASLEVRQSHAQRPTRRIRDVACERPVV